MENMTNQTECNPADCSWDTLCHIYPHKNILLPISFSCDDCAVSCFYIKKPKQNKTKYLTENVTNFTDLSHKLTNLSEDCPTLKEVIAATDQYRRVLPVLLIYASQAQLTTFRHFWNTSSNKKGLWWYCKYSTVK